MEREEKRLEQFRQLRKEIRGWQEYLVVGVDISKDTHNALMRTVSGAARSAQFIIAEPKA